MYHDLKTTLDALPAAVPTMRLENAEIHFLNNNQSCTWVACASQSQVEVLLETARKGYKGTGELGDAFQDFNDVWVYSLPAQIKLLPKTSSNCEVCGEQAVLRCSKCKCIAYCTRKHQQDAWPFHKLVCSQEAMNVTALSSTHRQGLFNSIIWVSYIFPNHPNNFRWVKMHQNKLFIRALSDKPELKLHSRNPTSARANFIQYWKCPFLRDDCEVDEKSDSLGMCALRIVTDTFHNMPHFLDLSSILELSRVNKSFHHLSHFVDVESFRFLKKIGQIGSTRSVVASSSCVSQTTSASSPPVSSPKTQRPKRMSPDDLPADIEKLLVMLRTRRLFGFLDIFDYQVDPDFCISLCPTDAPDCIHKLFLNTMLVEGSGNLFEMHLGGGEMTAMSWVTKERIPELLERIDELLRASRQPEQPSSEADPFFLDKDAQPWDKLTYLRKVVVLAQTRGVGVAVWHQSG